MNKPEFTFTDDDELVRTALVLMLNANEDVVQVGTRMHELYLARKEADSDDDW